MALTTHFAKVQFRLKQIVASPDEDKDVSNLNEKHHLKSCLYMEKKIIFFTQTETSKRIGRIRISRLSQFGQDQSNH